MTHTSHANPMDALINLRTNIVICQVIFGNMTNNRPKWHGSEVRINDRAFRVKSSALGVDGVLVAGKVGCRGLWRFMTLPRAAGHHGSDGLDSRHRLLMDRSHGRKLAIAVHNVMAAIGVKRA
jgi:hypothetical protein